MNGEASMFCVGDEPWHGLGTGHDEPATEAEAMKAAKFDWRVAGRATTLKNGKTRCVDMSSQQAETQKALATTRKEEKLKNGWAEVPAAVFCTDDGLPLDGDNLRHRVFYRVIEKAKLRRVRFHDLRHTFASLLIQNGESLVYIKDQLGHSSIKITVDTYGHLIPGANRQAVDRLDDQEPQLPAAANGSASTS